MSSPFMGLLPYIGGTAIIFLLESMAAWFAWQWWRNGKPRGSGWLALALTLTAVASLAGLIGYVVFVLRIESFTNSIDPGTSFENLYFISNVMLTLGTKILLLVSFSLLWRNRVLAHADV